MTKTAKRFLIATLGVLFLLATALFATACWHNVYSVEVSYDEAYGTVTVDPDKTSYEYGEKILVTADPNEGYYVASFTVNGVNKELAENKITLEVTDDLMIEVKFSSLVPVHHNVTLVTPEHGTLTLDQQGSLLEDTVVNGTVKADEGYELVAVTVNGTPIEVKEGKFSFRVNGDKEVAATFKKLPVYHSVTVGAHEHGTLELDHEGQVEEETLVNGTVTADRGYELVGVTVNGVSVEVKEGKFSFTVKEETTVAATFKAIEYKITVTETQHGTVELDPSTEKVAFGTTVTVTATANAGFVLDKIEVVGSTFNAESNTFVVDGETTVTATFKSIIPEDYLGTQWENPLQNGITVSINADGSVITVNGTVVTITLNSNYEYDNGYFFFGEHPETGFEFVYLWARDVEYHGCLIKKDTTTYTVDETLFDSTWTGTTYTVVFGETGAVTVNEKEAVVILAASDDNANYYFYDADGLIYEFAPETGKLSVLVYPYGEDTLVREEDKGLTVDELYYNSNWYTPFDDEFTLSVDAEGYVSINGEPVVIVDTMDYEGLTYYFTEDEGVISFSKIYASVNCDDFYGYLIPDDYETAVEIDSDLDGIWTGTSEEYSRDYTVEIKDGAITISFSEHEEEYEINNTFVFWGSCDGEYFTYYILTEETVYVFDGAYDEDFAFGDLYDTMGDSVELTREVEEEPELPVDPADIPECFYGDYTGLYGMTYMLTIHAEEVLYGSANGMSEATVWAVSVEEAYITIEAGGVRTTYQATIQNDLVETLTNGNLVLTRVHEEVAPYEEPYFVRVDSLDELDGEKIVFVYNDGTNLIASGAIINDKNKISSVSIEDFEDKYFTYVFEKIAPWTVAKLDNGSFTFQSEDEKYLKYNSGTDVATDTAAFEWTIAFADESAHTFKIQAPSANTRAILYSTDKDANVFGNYALTNADKDNAVYYYVQIYKLVGDWVEPQKPGIGDLDLEHEGTSEDPYSVADTLKVFTTLENGEYYQVDGTEQQVYVKGYVTNNPSRNNNGRGLYQVYIADEKGGSTTVMAFSINWNEILKDGMEMKADDYVVICGYLQNYYNSSNGTNTFEITYLPNGANPFVAEWTAPDAAAEVEAALAKIRAELNEKELTANYTLPTPTRPGVAYEWTGTSGEAAKIENGQIIVTRGEQDAVIQVNFTVSCDKESTSGSVTVTVKAQSSGEVKEPEDTPFYTLDTSSVANGANNTYTGNCDMAVTNNSLTITWNLEGNSQMQPWRLGGKNTNTSNAARSVTSKTPIARQVAQVVVALGTTSSMTLNSGAKFKVYNEVPTSTSTPIYEEGFTAAANGTYTFKADGEDWTNCYYQVTLVLTATSGNNGYVEFKSMTFYGYKDTTGGGTETPKHEHSFDYTNNDNADTHIVSCKASGCTGGFDTTEAHDWNGDACTKCGYTKSSDVPTAGSDILFMFTKDTFSKGTGGYTELWSASKNGFTLNIANFHNNSSGWDYIKTGHKSNAIVGTIATAEALEYAIARVVLTIDAVTTSAINKVYLEVASDASFTSDKKLVKEVAGSSLANGNLAFDLGENAAANLYYRISIDCKASSNGSITVSALNFLVNAD